jgi:hypothetical protein
VRNLPELDGDSEVRFLPTVLQLWLAARGFVLVGDKNQKLPKCGIHSQNDAHILNSSRQHIPDLAIYFLNGWAYDKSPTVNLIELRKTHLLVLDTLS